MTQIIQEWTKQNLWNTDFQKNLYHFKFFKGCIPQIYLVHSLFLIFCEASHKYHQLLFLGIVIKNTAVLLDDILNEQKLMIFSNIIN